MGDAIKISFQIILLVIVMATIGALIASKNMPIQTISEDLVKGKQNVMQVELPSSTVETYTSNRNIITDKRSEERSGGKEGRSQWSPEISRQRQMKGIQASVYEYCQCKVRTMSYRSVSQH